MKVYVVFDNYGAGGWISVSKIFLDENKAIEYMKSSKSDDVEEYEVIE